MVLFHWIIYLSIVIYVDAQFTLGDTCHPMLQDSFICLVKNTSVPLMFLCDGVGDCRSPNDEDPVFCQSMPCPTGYIRCEGGRCIRESKLCDDINDCIPMNFGEPAWDENLIQCPNPCITEKPCRNGGECTFIRENGTYVCDCPVGYWGRECKYKVKEESAGLDAVTIGVVSAVGGVAAVNTACIIYNRAKDAKDKAKQLKGKAKKALKHSKKLKKVGGKQKSESEKPLLDGNKMDLEAGKSIKGFI